MAIGPIELNGMISRTQDFSTVKQNEDNRGMIQQQTFQNQFERQIDLRHTQVVQKDDLRKDERKFDARDKGDNEYQGDGGRRKKRDKNEDGKVVIGGQRSFDMKI